MKRKNSTEVVAYGSLAITLLGVLWNIFFGYGQLTSKIDALHEDLDEFKIMVDKRFDKIDLRFEKIENRLDRIEVDVHKMDVRVTTVEQRKR
jgi:hypothetical protein